MALGIRGVSKLLCLHQNPVLSEFSALITLYLRLTLSSSCRPRPVLAYFLALRM